MNRLRLGVILPNVNVPVWVARMLEQINESSCAEVISVAYVEGANGEPRRLYGSYFRLDQCFFRPNHGPWARKDIRKMFGESQVIAEIRNEQTARFEAMDLDVIVNLSLNEVPESLWGAARCGVWSLRCNGGRVVIGTDFGWLELLNDECLIHCVVEARRGASIQAAARSVIASHPESFTHNQQSFLWRATALVPRALKELHSKGRANFLLHAESLGPAKSLSRPTTGQILALVCKQAVRVFETKVWRRWFPQRWALMAGISSEDGLPSLRGLSPIVPPRGVFWADPFLLERQGKAYVIFEEYVYKNYRAHISVAQIWKDGRIGKPQVALKRPYHLSYPFVFEYRGELYMIPETGQNRCIELYRCTRFPEQWTFEKTVMQDVRAVDATLIEHSMTWWMFVNIAGEGGSTWDELHIFYSDDPLSDRWSPHPMNPVVSDVRSARPAGRIFRRGGLLLRPSQDSSVRYGYALNLNRITRLTKSEYEEELLERLEPPKDGNILGVHTFNSFDGIAVVDLIMK